jgi:hypothetical protein
MLIQCFWIFLYVSCAIAFELPIQRLRQSGRRQDVNKSAALSHPRGHKATLVSEIDDVFVTSVSIGTPPQQFSLALDVNEYALWVADKTCAPPPPVHCPFYCRPDSDFCLFACNISCCFTDSQKSKTYTPNCMDPNNPVMGNCDDVEKFDSSQSSTYVPDGTKICNAAGSVLWQGFVGIDTVRIGSDNQPQLVVPSADFGQATLSSLGSYIDPGTNYDGVFGLGPIGAAQPGYTPPVVNAYNRGLIEKPIVTLWIRNDIHDDDGTDYNVTDAGKLTFGKLDDVHCGPLDGYHDIYQPERLQSTQIIFDAISLGNTKVVPTLNNATASFVLNGGGMYAVGGGPSMNALAIAAGATFNNQTNEYHIACNATFPPLVLTFDGRNYSIPSSQLIYNIGADVGCLLQFVSVYDDDNSLSLNTPFFRTFCTVFDVGNNRIGFAPAKTSP